MKIYFTTITSERGTFLLYVVSLACLNSMIRNVAIIWKIHDDLLSLDIMNSNSFKRLKISFREKLIAQNRPVDIYLTRLITQCVLALSSTQAVIDQVESNVFR